MIKLRKKGLSWGIVIAMIIGLLLILLVVPGISYLIKSSDSSFFKDNGINPKDDFKPLDYNTKLSTEELTADASMRALQMAINSLVSGKSLLASSSTSKDTKIKDFKITYYITYDLKLSSPTKEISTTKNSDSLDSEFWSYAFDSKPDTYSDVTGISKVHNMKIDVTYTDGSQPCSVNTKENNGDFVGSLTGGLVTWDGKDDTGKQIGQGCKDSPTWVQCPYIKAYYCGYKGSKDFEGGKTYWDTDGKSTSKVKTMIEYNQESTAQAFSLMRLGVWKRISNTLVSAWNIARSVYSKVPLIGISDGTGNYDRTKAYCYGGVQISGTDTTVKCEEGGKICYVCNFTLPQTVSTAQWITGFGDPQYISYYEQFPEGADSYWQYSTVKTAGIIGASMIVAGGVNYVTSKMGVKLTNQQVKQAINEGTEVLAQKYGKQVIEGGLKEVTEEALLSLTNKVGKKGVESVVKSGIFKESLVGVVKSTDNKPVNAYLSDVFESYLKEAADKSSTSIFKSSTKLSAEIEKTAIDNFERDLPTILSDNTLPKTFGYKGNIINGIDQKSIKESYSPQIMKNLRNSMSQKVDKQAVQEFLTERSTLNAFKNLLNEDGSTLSKDAVEKALKDSDNIVNSLKGLPSSYQKNIYDRTNDRIQKLMNNGGILKRSQDEFFSDIDNVGTLIADKDVSGLKDFLIAQGKSSGITLKESLGAVPTSGWVDGPILPLKLSINPLTMLNPVTQGSQAAQFLYGKRYTIIFGVALLAEYQDMVDNKLASGGTNNLIIGSPSTLAEKKREYPLVDEAEKYYLALHERYKNDKGVETTRFYLASPCKTDLVIQIQNCKCMRRPDALHYNFGGGPIDIKKGTLYIDPETDSQKSAIINLLESNQGDINSPLNNAAFTTTYGSLLDYVDDTQSVKLCEARSTWESITSTFGNKETADYTTKCIVVEPYVLSTKDANYCYPRYPESNRYKEAVSTVSLTGSVLLEIFSAGMATPLLVVVGAGDAAAQGLISEVWQKWPRADTEVG